MILTMYSLVNAAILIGNKIVLIAIDSFNLHDFSMFFISSKYFFACNSSSNFRWSSSRTDSHENIL